MFGPILETKRLVLRELKISDAKDMFEYAHLPEIGPMAGWEPHPNISHTKSVIQMYHEKKRFGQLGVFAIILKENKKMIGTVELHTYIKGFKAELGYTLNPAYRHQGYATEASEKMLHYGFMDLGLKRIEAATYTTNIPSSNVLIRLGFRHEGMKKDGYYLYDGTLHDVNIYGMTKDEYISKYIVKGEENGMQ